MKETPYISQTSLLQVLDVCGVDRDELLDDERGRLAFAVESSRMGESDASALYLRFYTALAELCPLPDWGVRVGRYVNMAALGALGYAVTSAPDLRHSFRLMMQFDPLVSLFSFYVEETSDHARMRFVAKDIFGGAETHLQEMVLFSFYQHISQAFPNRIQDMTLYFSGPSRDYLKSPSDPIHAKLVFDQADYQVEIPKDMYTAASNLHSPAVWELSFNTCKKRLSERKFLSLENPVDAVKAHVNAAIAANHRSSPHCQPLPGITEVAQRLGLKEKGLRQRLQRQDCQFREIKEQCRRRWMLKLLQDKNLNNQMIGFILGYKDSANFSRGCRAWFGVTPKVLRKKRASGEPVS